MAIDSMKDITRERRDKASKMFESRFGRGIDLNDYHVVLFGYDRSEFKDSPDGEADEILYFDSINVCKLTAKSIADAMSDALEIFTRECTCSSYTHVDTCERTEFIPKGFSILDDLNDLHAIYSRGGWVEPFTSKSEINAAFEEAYSLDTQAAHEAGWDNYETARQLRRKAEALRSRTRLPMIDS